ncbi:hypothetical protein BCV71DRAFT_254204 [Rhizopus microsporus]|uniref:Uncharacterized protein n=1 Tax=Rhizopus microsporus TaxID=58291 RepID=A0A1X0S8P3_RHIZD|nr:hypothetical protein BCV71DRAFT_254204 [Rhizopus microsporus]
MTLFASKNNIQRGSRSVRLRHVLKRIEGSSCSNSRISDTGNTVYAFVCAIPGNDYAEVRILNHLWNMYSNKNNVLHHLFSSPIPRLSLVGVAQHQALCDVCSSIFVNNAALSFTSVYFFPGSWGMKFML